MIIISLIAELPVNLKVMDNGVRRKHNNCLCFYYKRVSPCYSVPVKDIFALRINSYIPSNIISIKTKYLCLYT